MKRYDCLFCTFVVHPIFNNIKGTEAEKEVIVRRMCKEDGSIYKAMKKVISKAINIKLDKKLEEKGVDKKHRGDKSMEYIHDNWKEYSGCVDSQLLEVLGKECVKVINYLGDAKNEEKVGS